MWERLSKIRAELRARGVRQEAMTVRLASEIVEYARLNADGPGKILIEVPDLAYRLRESTSQVRRSLRLLEMKRIAKKTNSRNHWLLSA